MRKAWMLGLGLGVLVAVTSIADDNAAVVIKPHSECVLFDGDGNLSLVETEDSQIVVTQSQNGNVTLKCKVKKVDNHTGKAVKFDAYDNPAFPGAQCLILSPLPPFMIFTEDWTETVSARGNATLICRYKQDSDS